MSQTPDRDGEHRDSFRLSTAPAIWMECVHAHETILEIKLFVDAECRTCIAEDISIDEFPIDDQREIYRKLWDAVEARKAHKQRELSVRRAQQLMAELHS